MAVSAASPSSHPKILSLLGWPGITLGFVGTIGALVANSIVDGPLEEIEKLRLLMIDAAAALVLALAAAAFFSYRRMKRAGLPAWGSDSKGVVLELTVPLLTGAVFTYVLLLNRMYLAVPGSLLLFYGLALAAAAKLGHFEVRVLGVVEITLGFAALIYPDHALMYWAMGFGIAHILYGALIYFKYELS
jgi:hypothetical protein